MFLPGQNTLAKPDALIVPPFEQQLKKFKDTVIAHIAKTDPVMAAQVAETLANEAELSTKIIEASTVVLQTFMRNENEQALQMFAYWAEGNNLDAKVSDLGLKRQIISPEDLAAYPPVPAVKESDEHLKLRYYLAPYGFSSAGPKLGYKFQAMALDERPVISIESPSPGKVVVTYELGAGTLAGQVKDAAADRIGPGKIQLNILSWEGQGIPSDELMEAVEQHFSRDDVGVATDEVTFKKAEIQTYEITGTAYINKGPDASITKASAEAALASYAESSHRLGGVVDLDYIKHLLISAGAKKAVLTSPAAEMVCARHQAPFCLNISIEIETL
jgi:phage-related baseplate assembly protein